MESGKLDKQCEVILVYVMAGSKQGILINRLDLEWEFRKE